MTTNPKPLAPTVHLNGTSGDALLEQLDAAKVATRAALDALQAAAPNARDYYPQGADAYAVARQEHNSRVGRLQSVYTELAQLYGAVVVAIHG